MVLLHSHHTITIEFIYVVSILRNFLDVCAPPKLYAALKVHTSWNVSTLPI